MAKRTPGAAAVPEEEMVGALRVSANGWEGFVLEGFEPLLAGRRAPPVVAVEWSPAAMRAAGYQDPLALVHRWALLGRVLGCDVCAVGRGAGVALLWGVGQGSTSRGCAWCKH